MLEIVLLSLLFCFLAILVVCEIRSRNEYGRWLQRCEDIKQMPPKEREAAIRESWKGHPEDPWKDER